MGGSVSQMNSQALQRQEELAKLREQVPPGVDLDKGIPFKGSWIGTVIGVAVAFPVGIKRKSLTPLAFYGTTGAMIDIIFSISDYEQQRERRLRDYVAKLNKDKEQGDADAADDGWATPADQQNQPDRAEILRD